MRAVLNGDEDWNKPIRVVANDAYLVRDGIDPHSRFLEFPVPRQATAQGRLELQWSHARVAEAWLIKRRQGDFDRRIKKNTEREIPSVC